MAHSIARQPQQRCQVQGRTGKLTTNVAHSSDTDLPPVLAPQLVLSKTSLQPAYLLTIVLLIQE